MVEFEILVFAFLEFVVTCCVVLLLSLILLRRPGNVNPMMIFCNEG